MSEKERRDLLGRIVADADRVLELGRRAQGRCPKESLERKGIVEAAELLGQLLLQDVERKEDGAALKEGVSKDRIPSAHDPEWKPPSSMGEHHRGPDDALPDGNIALSLGRTEAIILQSGGSARFLDAVVLKRAGAHQPLDNPG